MKRKTTKTPKKVACLGGYRTVILTNGTEYVQNFNLCFGIIVLGSKEGASRMFLKDAVDVISTIARYRTHTLWAEIVECAPGCTCSCPK